MRAFTELYLALDATTRSSEKLDALVAYLRAAPHEDSVWAIWLLTGARMKRVLPRDELRNLAAEVSGVPEWLVAECYNMVGDLSETVALLVSSNLDSARTTAHQALSESLPLREIFTKRIEPMKRQSAAARREMLLATWNLLSSSDERFVFHKLISGSLRVGVSRGVAVRAIAEVAGVSAAEAEARIMGSWRPTAQAMQQILRPPDAAGHVPVSDGVLRPLPFFLAHQLDGDSDAIATALGPVGQYLAEWKFDGIRAQLVGPQANAAAPSAITSAAALWSRGEENISLSFPEVVASASLLPTGTVLDGEILSWDAGDAVRPSDAYWPLPGKPLAFAALQRRLNRKRREATLFEDQPVVMVVYDVLKLNGVDVRERGTAERRSMLESLFAQPDLREGAARIAPGRGFSGTLLLSPQIPSDGGWDALAAQRGYSRVLGVEGLMLKHVQSQYGAGRSKPRASAAEGSAHVGWYKWKIDPYTIDAVLIYAQRGSGRRASLYTDYTFGIWTEATAKAPAGLVPIAKAYSGLTDEEIDKVDRYVREHTISKLGGGLVVVEPTLVFELAFEGLAESTRHRAGIALRFPRMSRWRTDKPAAEADTLASVRSLLQSTKS